MSNQSTLFVRNLPPNTTEQELLEAFSFFGKIVNISLNSKNPSAQVTFSKHEEAQRAINHKNIMVQGQVLFVVWNHGSLLLSNLPPQIKVEELKKKLEQFHVISIQLKGQNQALVTFADQSIASEEMRKINGFDINGHKITATVFHSQPRVEYSNLPNYIVFVEQENQPELPQNAYATLKVNGGYLIFYPPNLAPQPQQPAETAPNKNPSPENRNPNQVKSDVYNDAFRFLEERTVYVVGFKKETTEEEICAFFSQAGRIIEYKKHVSGAEIIQYDSIESQNKALKFSKASLPNQKLPLAVLPFINKSIPRKESGLIQINELPPTTTIENLVTEFSEYGKIISASISPTGFDEPPYGLILFQLFEQAKSAKQAKAQKYPNIFLYPPLCTHDSILAFTESSYAPSNCLVIYGLPMKTLEPEVNQKCKDLGYIKSSFVLTDGQSKAAYVYFNTPADAAEAYYHFCNNKENVDLLNGNALASSCQRLREMTLPAEWNNLLLFVQRLPIDFGTSKLREQLNSMNLNFDSCFVHIYPFTGQSRQTALILMRDFAQATWLLKNIGSIFPGATASLFRSSRGYSTKAPSSSQTLPFKFPPQQRRPVSPREWMKQFIELNYNKDEQNVLIPKLQNLSIVETQSLMNFQNLQLWIQKNLQK